AALDAPAQYPGPSPGAGTATTGRPAPGSGNSLMPQDYGAVDNPATRSHRWATLPVGAPDTGGRGSSAPGSEWGDSRPDPREEGGVLEVAAGRLEAFARERLALPGLAVGLIGPGGWRRELAVGVADVASGRPMEPGALLPIASVSKAMTAVALLREREAGRIDLDAPGHEYLPVLPLPTPV